MDILFKTGKFILYASTLYMLSTIPYYFTKENYNINMYNYCLPLGFGIGGGALMISAVLYEKKKLQDLCGGLEKDIV
ncbi:MAG: hypothetical protein AABW41_00125 [Nanoarchaeota archaeon]